MKIYIAGPMRGYPDFNFPAFFEAEEWLRQTYDPVFDAIEVFNPARRDEEMYGALPSETGDLADIPQFDLRDALEADLLWILYEATHIFMLPGWTESKGATAEHALAEALGLSVMGAWE